MPEEKEMEYLQNASWRQAELLAQAVPYFQRHHGQIIVIKMGGNAMTQTETIDRFAKDIVLLRQVGIKPVVVHGGGPQIGQLLEQLGIQSQFHNGMRITDQATMAVVEMVLAGLVNKQIVRAINAQGGKAVGLSGSDGAMITARKLNAEPAEEAAANTDFIDLGYVGEPVKIHTSLLTSLINDPADFIPVIAPIGVQVDLPTNQIQQLGTLNINADVGAAAIAGALRAKRLVMLTNVDGVMNAQGEVIPELAPKKLRDMLREGVASGGMRPKLEAALFAKEAGADAVTILNGSRPHALLVELFTDTGLGTLVGDTDLA